MGFGRIANLAGGAGWVRAVRMWLVGVGLLLAFTGCGDADAKRDASGVLARPTVLRIGWVPNDEDVDAFAKIILTSDLSAASSFIESMRTRQTPNADLARCHASACLVHLANTSYRVGQKQLQFDAANEVFTDSDEANALQRLPYRDRYRIPDQV